MGKEMGEKEGTTNENKLCLENVVIKRNALYSKNKERGDCCLDITIPIDRL